MKKTVSIILTIAIMLLVLPSGAFSITASAATSSYYTYTISNGEATITKVNPSISGFVTIPQTLGGYNVTAIGQGAFADCASITSISIGDKVKVINEGAFLGCTGIVSISIGANVKSINPSSFLGCINIANITVSQSNTSYYSLDNCIIETETLTLVLGCKNSKIPLNGKIGAIGPNAFYYCSGLTSITIPNSVKKIGDSAFYGSDINSIDLGDGVTTIEANAFAECLNLEYITIPDCISFIGSNAFVGCTELYGYSYQNGFYLGNDDNNYLVLMDVINHDLNSYSLASGVKCIYDEAMSQCVNLKSLTLPSSVTCIGDFAFANCPSLTNLSIPNSVITVGASAFLDCDKLVYNNYNNGKYLGNSSNKYIVFVEPTSTGITKFNFATGVKCISSKAFSGCKNLENIDLPDTISMISEGSFEDCSSLKAISLSDNIKHIGGYAFKGCSELKTVNFGSSVLVISGYAFYKCNNLNTVNYRASEQAKNKIFIFIGNGNLLNAKWNYLECGEFSGTTTNPVKPIVIDYGNDFVMLYPFEGYEFSKDGVNWQISNTFKDLEDDTTYTFYQRINSSFGGPSKASSIVVKTALMGLDTKTVYDVLRYCIQRDYNKLDSDGDPCIRINETFGNNHTGYYEIADKGSYITFTLLSMLTGDISSLGTVTSFNLSKNSTKLEVSHLLAYYYNGSLYDDAFGTANMERYEHAYGDEYSFYRSGSYVIKSQDFCDTFNDNFTLLTNFFDNYLFSKYGMGLKTLGFSSYNGAGILVCDPLIGYHAGPQEVRGDYDAGCVIDGSTGYVYCSCCDNVIQDREIIYCKGYHSYDNDCDKICNTCNEHRNIIHTYSADCDDTCNICSAKRTPLTPHVFDNEEDMYCNKCGGGKYTPGDIDGVEGVTDRDAVHLLYHTFLPNLYSVNQNCDFNGDGSVNDKDAIYLLYHTFLPGLYPIG